MAHYIPKSVAEILRALGSPFGRKLAARGMQARPGCDCGHNPYRAYYRAGEQAMIEAVTLAQTACHADMTDENARAEMVGVIRSVSTSEIDGFCAVCRKYGLISSCRFAGAKRRVASTAPAGAV
jgi:hypothetical protein